DEPCNATAAPVNTDLNCSNVVSGTIEFASNSGIASSCGGTPNDDVWYQFTATSTVHHINLNNITGSTTDLYHAVYSGACSGLTLIPGTCSDPENSVVTGLSIGTTYYVQIYSWGSATQTTTFNLCIGTPPPPPANDVCTTATALPCGTINLSGTTISASNTPHGTSCTMSNYGVWYTFVGDGNSTTVSSTANAGFDHEMSISSGSCGSFTSLACRDSGFSGGTESYNFITTNGLTYY